jgi:pimeloyl-ACP methyl ester carboxylesterase
VKVLVADDGERIRVAHSGEGPPLVMLHGWTASHAEWAPLMHGLAPHFSIYRWDARAHGGHPLQAPTPPTVQRMAKDLRNLLETFGLRGATVVGHSMGALTLWEYIRQFGTDGLGRLVLVDQSPRLVTDAGWPHGIYGDFDAARAAAFLADLEADYAEAVLRLAALGLNERARQKYEENSAGWHFMRLSLARQFAPPLVAVWRSLVAGDWREVLPAIDVPTLLVYGAESNFYDAATRDWVHAHIPGSKLLVYEGADHSPHQAAPKRFVRDLLDFAGESPSPA